MNFTPNPNLNPNLNLNPQRLGLRLRLGAKAGFTLVEILIATSIMAILLAAIHAAFFSALGLRERTIDSLEASLPVEQALQTLQRDLANIVISTNGTFIGPLQTTNPTNALPGQVGPDFYTSGGELDGMVPWGNVEKIDYLLSAPTNGRGGPGRTSFAPSRATCCPSPSNRCPRRNTPS